jgi:hypothetical protein
MIRRWQLMSINVGDGDMVGAAGKYSKRAERNDRHALDSHFFFFFGKPGKWGST